MHESDVAAFVAASGQARTVLSHYGTGAAPADARAAVEQLVRSRTATANELPAVRRTRRLHLRFGADLPFARQGAGRQDGQSAQRDVSGQREPAAGGQIQALNISEADQKTLGGYKKQLDNATKFIPTWVKVAVAIALGLGTMIGWKRIVVTVGERIGKTHLTYAQGASAELVAMLTIGAADAYGLPVSTTHVLSSGVAGTMVANRSGLQWATVRNLIMAWVLTLPVSIALAGGLYWLLRTFL